MMKLYTLLIGLCLISSNLVAMQQTELKGDIFTAISISGDIKNVLAGIQADIRHSLGKNFSASPIDNLHITIQLVATPSYAMRDYIEVIESGLTHVPSQFKKWAKNMGWDQKWDFSSKLKNGKLTISKNGTVMLTVGKSDSLIQMGKIIEQELEKVGVKTIRNDVAQKYVAHITLGKIPEDKVIEAKAKKCTIDFQAKFTGTRFIVDKFVLLQSNRPAKVRQYAVHKKYKLHLGK